MICEKSHVAGATSTLGQHCARCHAVLPKQFTPGARVAVIVLPKAEVSGCYQVFQVTKETPRMCLT